MQKDAAEMRLHDALLQFWRGQLARIRERILPGVPRARRASPNDRLDKAFWDSEDRELLAVLMPILTDMATESGQSFVEWAEDKYGLGVDWGLVNARAADWARAYSYKLVKGARKPRKINGLNTTTAKQLQSRIANWIETPGANLGELYSTLEKLPAFNAHRARLVGVTESTRAYAAGTISGARAFEDEGFFVWRKIWNTLNDQIVCKLCSPMHDVGVVGVDTEFETGLGPIDAPPLHPACRCFLTLEPVEGAAADEARLARESIAKIVGEIGAETAALQDQSTALGKEMRRIFERLGVLHEEGATQSEIDLLESLSSKTNKEWAAIIARIGFAKERLKANMRGVLYVNNPALVKAKYITRFTGLRRRTTDEGFAEFGKMVGTGTMDTTVDVRGCGRRRSYESGGHIWLSTSSAERTTIHELGHSLERNDPEVHRKALAFLKKRTAGEAATWLGDRYSKWEKTRRDKFVHPYMGKDYGDKATEIVSMGMEYMWRDAAAFARDDPEYFDFMYSLLRGR